MTGLGRFLWPFWSASCETRSKEDHVGPGSETSRQRLRLPAPHTRSLIHHRERGSPMKNRKREICTSGSARDEAGQPPHLLGHRRQFLHLAAGTAVLPAMSSIA